MSRENVEVVRRLYDALGRRESEAVLALYDSEVEIDASHGLFKFGHGKRVYHGHDGLRRWRRRSTKHGKTPKPTSRN
jgi:ketosteroid isomerase-like protein